MPRVSSRRAPAFNLLAACILLLQTLPLACAAGPRLCVLIRAVPSQTIEALLWSLFAPPAAAHGLRAFVINTDPAQQGSGELRARTEAFSRRKFRSTGQQVSFLPLAARSFDKSLYAYDATDEALDVMSRHAGAGCDYLLVTNGDNLYSAYLLDAIAPLMARRAPLIAWDFVSHHLRNNTANTHISVNVREKFIDLGSYATRFDFYSKYGLRFLENAREFSGSCAGYFAADYCMAERVARLAARLKTRVVLMHSILMFHQ